MKHKSRFCAAVRAPLYPNAADPRYFAGKALEVLTAILSGFAAITAMAMLLTMA